MQGSAKSETAISHYSRRLPRSKEKVLQRRQSLKDPPKDEITILEEKAIRSYVFFSGTSGVSKNLSVFRKQVNTDAALAAAR